MPVLVRNVASRYSKVTFTRPPSQLMRGSVLQTVFDCIFFCFFTQEIEGIIIMGNKQNKRGKGADRTKHDAPDRNRWVKHELDENDIHPPRKTKKRPSKTSRKSITTSPQSIDDLYEADRQLRSQITGRPLAETIDVHTCYQEAVQLPAAEVENLINMYAEAQTSFGKPDEFGQFRKPLLLRYVFKHAQSNGQKDTPSKQKPSLPQRRLLRHRNPLSSILQKSRTKRSIRRRSRSIRNRVRKNSHTQ